MPDLNLIKDRAKLEQAISKHFSEAKQNGKVEHYSISWNALANVLKTSHPAVLTAWTNGFAQRENLLCSPDLNGVNFTPIIPTNIT